MTELLSGEMVLSIDHVITEWSPGSLNWEDTITGTFFLKFKFQHKIVVYTFTETQARYDGEDDQLEGRYWSETQTNDPESLDLMLLVLITLWLLGYKPEEHVTQTNDPGSLDLMLLMLITLYFLGYKPEEKAQGTLEDMNKMFMLFAHQDFADENLRWMKFEADGF
jgi:hypothetical protein